MSLTTTLDALEAIANGAVEGGELDGVNVYRWWEPTMRLPALWHWLTPSAVERIDTCTIRDRLRLTVSIGAMPGSSSGADARTLELYADAYRDAIDTALAGGALGRHPDNRRLGLNLVSDRLGDVSVLAVEFPLELVQERSIPFT